MSMCILTARSRTTRAASVWDAAFFVRILAAFRLRRLAQSLPRKFCSLLVCGILLFAHFYCASSQKTCGRLLGRGTFLEILNKIVILRCPNDFRRRRLQQNVRLISGARHFSCKFSQNMHLLRCPSAFRLRRLAQNARLIKWDLVQALVRSSCGDPGKVLPERSLHDLVQVL